MASSKPRRLTVHLPTGDLIEGGYIVYQTEHGPIMDWIDDVSGEGRGPWKVYSWGVDRILDHNEWFAKGSPWQTVGMSESEFWSLLASWDAKKRAVGYEVIVSNYGPHELDQYPSKLTHAELRRRYPKLVGELD